MVVPETHFQFNAIVQNQLPRSSRNIRAKFTPESVLLAWPRRHRPKLSCPARSQTSILGTLTYEIIAAPVTDSPDRRETAVETATASGNRGDYAISRRPVSLSLMPGTPANSLYCGTWPIRATRLRKHGIHRENDPDRLFQTRCTITTSHRLLKKISSNQFLFCFPTRLILKIE